MTEEKLTHITEKGDAHMVDVSAKDETLREAAAQARVRMKPSTLRQIKEATLKKGDVLGTARVAGIMAAKKTHELIPLCHPLMITSVNVDLEIESDESILVTAKVTCKGQTGVEMEALTAASVASLTIYDMAKAVDKGIIIDKVRLISKKGGKSGEYKALR